MAFIIFHWLTGWKSLKISYISACESTVIQTAHNYTCSWLIACRVQNSYGLLGASDSKNKSVIVIQCVNLWNEWLIALLGKQHVL